MVSTTMSLAIFMPAIAALSWVPPENDGSDDDNDDIDGDGDGSAHEADDVEVAHVTVTPSAPPAGDDGLMDMPRALPLGKKSPGGILQRVCTKVPKRD